MQIPPNPSENWARSLRYTWFDALAAQQHACIATAHTLSDQAETVLFRMARGTGLHGMAGIPAVRGVYRRPFLCLTRSDTTAYCAALGQHYVQDESNFSDAYARNRIRHYAVPALQTINPAAERAVGRLCNQLQELNIWLENLAEKLLAQAACGGGYSIPILAAADAPVLAAALRMLAARARDPEEKICAGSCGHCSAGQRCGTADAGCLLDRGKRHFVLPLSAKNAAGSHSRTAPAAKNRRLLPARGL